MAQALYLDVVIIDQVHEAILREQDVESLSAFKPKLKEARRFAPAWQRRSFEAALLALDREIGRQRKLQSYEVQ